MYYELKNTPDIPVSLSDAKDFLKVTHSKEDALIQGLVESAISYGEKYTGRDFSIKTWDGFSEGLCLTGDALPYVELMRSPLVSVENVYNSISGVYVENTDYIRKDKFGYSRILFKSPYPMVDDTVAYTFKIGFTSGYSILPEELKTVVLQHVNFLYENRGDVPSDNIKQINSIYRQYRIAPIYGV